MTKRKADASLPGPSKKAKLSQPHDTRDSQTSNADTTAASTSPAAPQRREKRKRTDAEPPVDTPDEESDTNHSSKRPRTESPDMEPWKSIPGFVPWPDIPYDPQSETKFWESEYYTADLTEVQKEFRLQSDMHEMSYLKCSCGKWHHAPSRKSWHFTGGTPEPDSEWELEPRPSLGQTVPRSPRSDLADNLESVNKQVSRPRPRPPSDVPDSHVPEPHAPVPHAPVSQNNRAHSPSPTPSEVPPAPLAIPNKAQVSRRLNAKRDAKRSARQRQTDGKTSKVGKVSKVSAKGKKEKTKKNKQINKDKESDPTPVAEEVKVSRRSSRRDPTSQLWFLDDNGKACSVAASSR
ncbi:hypothetical protein V8C35DRAFT_290827 [Trichoderma chlorosporum]